MTHLSCDDCGRPYGDRFGFPDLVVPDSVWAAIAPRGGGGGLLCPSCMCRRAHRLGIECAAQFRSGPFAVLDDGKVHPGGNTMNDIEAEFIKLHKIHISTLLDFVRAARRRAERAEAKLGRARAQVRALLREKNKPAPPYLGGERVVSRVTPELRDYLAASDRGEPVGSLLVFDPGADWLGNYDVPLVDIVGMPGDQTLCLRLNGSKRWRDLQALRAQEKP